MLLPLFEGPSEPTALREPKAAERTATRAERLLVVEDDEMVRATTLRALERAGFQVETAADGRLGMEAWERARGAFDLVLTNIRHARGLLGGMELAKRLLGDRPALPIVFMTGYADEDLDGATVLRKPFGPRQLVKMMHDHTRGRGGPREVTGAGRKLDSGR